MNIPNIISDISQTDATILIAIGPTYDALAIIGIIVCIYATISRRVCTKDRPTAAAIHILLVVWLILLWRDSTSSIPPLLLSLFVRTLVLAVTVILVFSARLNFLSHRAVLARRKRIKVKYDKQ